MQLPGAGPVLYDIKIPDIMYADDVKLLACSALELQQLLDVLDLFCTLFDMQVNVSPHKTCIVLYGTAAAQQQQQQFTWTLRGSEVPVCEEYKDLGVRCLATGRVMRRKGGARGVVPGAQALAQAGRKAMHALLSTCRKHHLVQPFIKLRLFDALVEPVMSYACQVWGPWVFHGMLEKPWSTGSEEVHLDFLRIMAGVGRQVKRELLLWEFMRYPIMWHWVRLEARFWQRLVLRMLHTPFLPKHGRGI